MENTNWDSAANAAPQNDWRNDETNAWLTDPSTQDNELRSAEAPRYGTVDTSGLNATTSNDDPDEDTAADTEENEEETAGDWGHVDPAESNSPFPDSNEPTAPGSAV